ncbi:hypothetical protein ACHAWF_009668 [Thalassiosira exigua]
MHDVHRLWFAEQGIACNNNGGFYKRGFSYGIETKLFVAATYADARDQGDGIRPNLSQVARECNVGWHFVKKIEDELLCEGKFKAPRRIYAERERPIGQGSISLDPIDVFVLYRLYWKHPTRSLESYVNWLSYYTGTIVSASTVSRLFNHGFPVRGGLCKPNLVPYDKFRPQNIAKAKEYLRYLARLDPRRIKYRDEESQKDKSISNRKPRRDVVTGHVPCVMTDPDLRNTYSIIGICGIDKRVSPVQFRITESSVDAELFSTEIEAPVASGFFRAGDTLVLDNAEIHSGKENREIEDWLWNYHEIFVLFLPARTPEWNPIELLWGTLEARFSTEDLSSITGSDCVVKATVRILERVTHKEVRKMYNHSGVFRVHKNTK